MSTQRHLNLTSGEDDSVAIIDRFDSSSIMVERKWDINVIEQNGSTVLVGEWDVLPLVQALLFRNISQLRMTPEGRALRDAILALEVE